MATLTQKIEAEQKLRELLADNELPEPDEVEYGHTCIRALWRDSKTCVVVDIDESPDDGYEPGQRLDFADPRHAAPLADPRRSASLADPQDTEYLTDPLDATDLADPREAA